MNKGSAIRTRRFTEAQIIEILLSDEGSTATAKRYGMSPQGVRGIWTGAIYRDVAPHIERRRTGLKCSNCRFYAGSSPNPRNHGITHNCGLGFPDIKESRGITTANECNWYAEAV